jgi:antitoxin CcdA
MAKRALARRRTPKRGARKSATNLSLRVDLVRRAKALGLNLSQVVESALENAIREREQTTWLEENQQAIHDYNEFVAAHGVFGDELRQF